MQQLVEDVAELDAYEGEEREIRVKAKRLETARNCAERATTVKAAISGEGAGLYAALTDVMVQLRSIRSTEEAQLRLVARERVMEQQRAGGAAGPEEGGSLRSEDDALEDSVLITEEDREGQNPRPQKAFCLFILFFSSLFSFHGCVLDVDKDVDRRLYRV